MSNLVLVLLANVPADTKSHIIHGVVQAKSIRDIKLKIILDQIGYTAIKTGQMFFEIEKITVRLNIQPNFIGNAHTSATE